MKFSYRWLSEMVPGLSIKPEELQRLITMKTAECEGIEQWGEYFQTVAAVRVISVEPLAKGRNKKVVIETASGEQKTVVCGAPNVQPGMTTVWAPPGTSLRGKQIGHAVFEDVESEGMLCSAEELGLNRDGSGLIELSSSAAQSLQRVQSDWIIEIDNKSLTHRPDLWGHYGMAREVAAIAALALTDPVKMGLLPEGTRQIEVDVADYRLCPRYSALVFENVTVAPSPLWMQARLQAIGLNPINNIVDVTNYILAELPQPMHAFDADKLEGVTIFVRKAQEGEKLRALNDEDYTLHADDLVIADANGPVALAGVVGGADSAISESTKRIVLESANFQAASVRFTSVRHRLRTDASMRFEKSLDPENTVRGLARAVELLQEVCPGIRLMGGLTDSRGQHSIPPPIDLPVSLVVRKLGKQLSSAQVQDILKPLGFGIAETAPDHLRVSVPSWRATKDISIKEDLVEEVGRMVGYGEITPQAPLIAALVPPASPMRVYLRKLRTQIAAQGFTEAYHYSFVNEAQWKRFGFGAEDHLAILNPIASELTHMRRSLLPGIFDTIIKNTRNFHYFRFFEIGREIHPQPDSLPDEVYHLTAVLYNAHGNEQDFFELKRVLQCLFPGAQLSAAEARSWEHPVRTAQITWRGTVLGRFFELHPSLLEAEKVEGRAFLFDVNVELAEPLADCTMQYKPLRRYPSSTFDLSVITDGRRPVAEIQILLEQLGGTAIVSLDFVRQYSGPPLEQGQKSVSYRVEVGAPDRTLTTAEASEVRSRIIEGMLAAGYELRGV